jgi:two-component system sensor histidine kinase CpxA
MPRRFYNLYARILLWLLVNVIVLGSGFWIVLRWQFHEGMQGALGGIVADRLQTIGREVYAALSASGHQDWDRLLLDFGQRHDVKTALIAFPSKRIAGIDVQIPDEVRRHIQSMHPELSRRLQRDGVDDPPPPPPPRDEIAAFLFGEDFTPPHDRGPPHDGRLPPMMEAEDTGMPVKLGTFMVPVGKPTVYFTGIRLPLLPGLTRRDGPLFLVIVTDRITGGGLFFDVKPWLYGLFGAMSLSALLWLPFVSGITRSIRANMQATEQIAKGHFDVSVPENRSDELGRLSHAVNQMAIQIDGIVRGQKRFLGDIAHELCSPIARMEMSLGILENKLTDSNAIRLADVREELRQISLLVNELLSFSKASLGQNAKPPEDVVLLSLVDEVAGMEAIPPAHLRLQIGRDIVIKAVPDLLRRAVGNILRNARLHAPESVIEVSATRKGDRVLIQIADEGPGVPEDSLPRLFDPFYRVDTSRDRQTGGSGLGLAIVKTCITTCDGSVAARNREPHGLILEIELPRA